MSPADANRLFYAKVWPHRAMVLRTARFLTRNHAEADDLAQETLVKAFKSIDQFQEAGNTRGWLSAILRNTWIDRMRAAGKRGTSISLDDEAMDIADNRPAIQDQSGNPAAILEEISDSDLISGLKTLPEEIRWTLLLVDVESMEHAEAARILDVPEGTVKSRAHRGRRMLREYLVEARGARTASVEER